MTSLFGNYDEFLKNLNARGANARRRTGNMYSDRNMEAAPTNRSGLTEDEPNSMPTKRKTTRANGIDGQWYNTEPLPGRAGLQAGEPDGTGRPTSEGPTARPTTTSADPAANAPGAPDGGPAAINSIYWGQQGYADPYQATVEWMKQNGYYTDPDDPFFQFMKEAAPGMSTLFDYFSPEGTKVDGFGSWMADYVNALTAPSGSNGALIDRGEMASMIQQILNAPAPGADQAAGKMDFLHTADWDTAQQIMMSLLSGMSFTSMTPLESNLLLSNISKQADEWMASRKFAGPQKDEGGLFLQFLRESGVLNNFV